MGNSAIQWTDKTWAPLTGCTRVSPGCDHCYAFQLHDMRHLAWKRDRWDTAPKQYHQPFSTVQLLHHRLAEPLGWRTPSKIFLTSMGDLFHDDVPDEYLDHLFAVMALTPQHTYQVLTKRPERMARYLRCIARPHDISRAMRTLPGDTRHLARYQQIIRVGLPWPLPNVWLGTSVENQRAADERIPHLRRAPAVIRFLSMEPLLERVNLIGDPDDGVYGPIWDVQSVKLRTDYGTGIEHDVAVSSGIDWVIVGGESGTHARPMDLQWVRDLRLQCGEAGIALFVKQLGARPYMGSQQNPARLRDRHGGNADEWPADLRIRAFPEHAVVPA